MSYILDALKKSERQRPPGAVPDLFTVHGPQSQPPSPRRPAGVIFAAALLFVVLVVGGWVWIGTGRRDEGAARPPVTASPQPGVAAALAPAASRPVVAPLPRAASRAAAAARRPAAARPLSAASAAQQSREAAASRAVPVASPVVPAVPTPVPVPTPPPAPGTAPSAPEPTGQAPSPAIPAAAPEAAAPAPEETPPADGRVLDLAELPAPIRAGLPKLLVSGHVWSEEPSMRLLSVDDRLLHEGGEAATGVSLQEITPEGAVLVFKGWRFRIAGGRP